MGTGWIWIVIVAICLLEVTSVSGRICVLGTKPDESNGGKVRFVLTPGDPCSCTDIMLGGHNTHAPPRKNKPVYIDSLPMDAEGLRRSQGCPDESAQSEYPTLTSTSQVETSDSPVTSVAPVVYKDCQEALEKGQVTSGVYAIKPYGNKPFDAYCDMKTSDTDRGYIVIQRRVNGSEDFNRNWADYKEGFGDLDGEFWLGNEKIHKISYGSEWELLVTLTAFDGSVALSRFVPFYIKVEKNYYEVAAVLDSETDYLVNAGDAFDAKKFSTTDRDNDDDQNMHCAQSMKGGWWFKECHNTQSNLNGLYHNNASVERNQGIYWTTWNGHGDESLKATEMKIRRN